jgi:hypothetical protein
MVLDKKLIILYVKESGIHSGTGYKEPARGLHGKTKGEEEDEEEEEEEEEEEGGAEEEREEEEEVVEEGDVKYLPHTRLTTLPSNERKIGLLGKKVTTRGVRHVQVLFKNNILENKSKFIFDSVTVEEERLEVLRNEQRRAEARLRISSFPRLSHGRYATRGVDAPERGFRKEANEYGEMVTDPRRLFFFYGALGARLMMAAMQVRDKDRARIKTC